MGGSTLPRALASLALTIVLLLLCLLSPRPQLTLELPHQSSDSPSEYRPGVSGQVQAVRKARVRAECQDHAGHHGTPFYASKFHPASLTLGEEEGLAWSRVDKVV